MNIIYIAQWLFGGNSQILHYLYSDALAHRQKVFKPESIFKQTRVNIFLPQMASFLNYVTATLWASFAWRGSNVCF